MVPLPDPQILSVWHAVLFRAVVAVCRPFEMDLPGAFGVRRPYCRRIRQDLVAARSECFARLADPGGGAVIGHTDSLRQEGTTGVDADHVVHVPARRRPNDPDEARCDRKLAVPCTDLAVRRSE